MNKAFSGGRREESFILDYLGAVNHFYFTENIQSVSVPYDINVISVQMWYNPYSILLLNPVVLLYNVNWYKGVVGAMEKELLY